MTATELQGGRTPGQTANAHYCTLKPWEMTTGQLWDSIAQAVLDQHAKPEIERLEKKGEYPLMTCNLSTRKA